MVVGFNHNIRYKGELFHVQTEDSGRANPHIITLLYRGGTILASAKTSYADIIKAEQLELVVESIMKEQHKEMMRRLKGGEFDARIFGQPATSEAPGETPPPVAIPPAKDSKTPGSLQPEAEPVREREPAPEAKPARQHPEQMINPTKTPSPNGPQVPPTKRTLDEVILDYLITGEEK